MNRDSCLICEKIEAVKAGGHPHFIRELETGYVLFGEEQFFKGYTLFLCKRHVGELHDLDEPFRKLFLFEMSQVAEAVFRAFKPRKLNYELLGNIAPHLHWHVFPRHEDDPSPKVAVWLISDAFSETHRPTEPELQAAMMTLREALDAVIAK